MADQKTTDLTPLPSALTTGDKLYVVRAGVDYQADKDDLPFDASGAAAAVASDLAAHEADTANPHGVTKTQVGLGSVTNDAQLKAADLDTDGTLAANSDTKIPSQKAVKTYVDTAVTGLMDFKGATDASGNPNYPAASKGDAYVVSVAGKVGGASGKTVDIGDVYLATADNAGGTEASVGTSWSVLEHNLVGAVIQGGALGTPSSGTLTNCTGLPEAGQTLADNTTNNVSTTKHGYAPKAPNDATKFLDGTGAWSTPAGGSGLGYALCGNNGSTVSPADSTNYYLGANGRPLVSTEGQTKMYVPKAGTLKVAEVWWFAATVAGSGENISVYFRLNGTTDTLIATVGDTASGKRFSNTGLSIALAQGDYFEIKVVCPAWATNPAGVQIGFSLYIE